MKKILTLNSLIILFMGCSYLPATKKRFTSYLDYYIGKSINEFTYYYHPDYVEKKNFYKEYYFKFLNKKCKFKYNVNQSNIIYRYEVLTPDTCKWGYSASP